MKRIEYFFRVAMLTVYPGEFQGVLHTPAKSCSEHMLEDLPAALPGVARIDSTAMNCAKIASAFPNPYGLPADEALALVDYTSDSASSKENCVCYNINNLLEKNEALSLLQLYLSYLMSAMSKLRSVKTTVCRAVPIDGDFRNVREKYEVGKKVHWICFATSMKVNSVLGLRESREVFIVFQKKKSYYSSFANESESPNSHFVVFKTCFVVVEGTTMVETEPAIRY